MIFRNALGNKYDEFELPIWIESGKEVRGIAKALGRPSQTAKEVSETFGIVAKIMLGPELTYQHVQESDDSIVIQTTGCPMLNRAQEMGLEPTKLLNVCHAFGRSAVENLNPKYTLKSRSHMCAGDSYCARTIERK
ncbi:MAG: hypothetical protein MUO26_10375 [Methanotrichaceae archaeon]|nr:hypothetical protein [Methanotrichaceae archaeon]